MKGATPMTLGQSRSFGMLVALWLLLAFMQAAEAAPIRPSPTAQGCSLSGQQLDELRGKNPGAMNACGDLANRAASEGRSFSFMCDAGGKVSCCDDRQCITVTAFRSPTLPRTIIPQAPGAIQQRGVEGEPQSPSGQEGK